MLDGKGIDFSKILKAINYVKRASAHLDEIEMTTDESLELFVGFSTVVVKEYETAMSKDDFVAFEWLADEAGDSLTDEVGNILTE